jgi:hypothetical protein
MAHVMAHVPDYLVDYTSDSVESQCCIGIFRGNSANGYSRRDLRRVLIRCECAHSRGESLSDRMGRGLATMTPEEMGKIVGRIEGLAARRGHTLQSLEEAAGLPRNRIAKWKVGGAVRPGMEVEHLHRIARLFGVPMDYFLEDEPGPSADATVSPGQGS